MSDEKESTEKETPKAERMLMPREILHIWQEMAFDFKIDDVDKELYLYFTKQNSTAGKRARKKFRAFRDSSTKILKALLRLERAKAAGEHIDFPSEEEEE